MMLRGQLFIRNVVVVKRFSSSDAAAIDKTKYFYIRAGDDHRFIGIWVVVVDGRVLVRPWNDKAGGWYRAFLTRVVLPNRTFVGWLIPGSMYPIALSYLSGILVQLAAIGALFLLANMFLFLNLNLRHPRDDYVMLTLTQLIILITNPGGVPAILRALGILG